MSHKKIFIFGDYSQAEARVVAWKGPVPKLKNWFQTGEDVHLNVAREMGQLIHEKQLHLPGNLFLRKHPELYTKEDDERDISKRTVHANNYGQGAEKFALITGLPQHFAALLQTLYHSRFPEIRSNYQRSIREDIDRNKTLTTPLGGKIVFYDIVSEDLYREGYAWYPQNIVGYLTTRWYVRIQRHFKQYKDFAVWTPANLRSAGFDVRLQVHDSIGIVVPDDRESISYAINVLRETGEQQVIINNEPLVIPVDFKVGSSWGELKDYKQED
jgi:DNA polymerase I-like protein with 3'-5' exonuclease and polymerase domains